MKAPPNAERRPCQGGVPSSGGDLSSGLTVPPATYEPALRRALAWGEDDRTDAAAVHEAGHAVARLALGLPFRYATIRRRGGRPGDGYVAVHPRRRVGMDAMHCGVSAAAGPEAERRHYTEQGDAEAADWLLQMLGGCDDDDAALSSFPASTQRRLREWATALLAAYWPAVIALADRLLTDPRTLTQAESRQIVKALPCWPEYLR